MAQATHPNAPQAKAVAQSYCILSVLLQMGFTRNVVTYAPRGLLHHGSTLTCSDISQPSAVHFCGTILQLAPTGRYPASCHAEPGLSSRSILATSDCLSNFPMQITVYLFTLKNSREKVGNFRGSSKSGL